jgi:hypothetical protein
MVIQYGVTVRDYKQENKILRKVNEIEKDKFGVGRFELEH